MRRMRTGLLTTAAACVVLAGPLAAQTAPTMTGESGLFEIKNADSLPAGRFSFGLYFSQSDRTAATSLIFPTGASNPLRYGLGTGGLTLGYGFTSNWEGTLTFGEKWYSSNDRDWTGTINGRERSGRISHSETDKVRIGTKLVLNPNTADPVKVALFGGFSLPTQSKNDPDVLGTYRTDWDFGLSFTYGILTLEGKYVLVGDLGTPTPFGTNTISGFDLPNEISAGLGINVPVIPELVRGIFEVHRLHYDGGDARPPDFTEALLGGRVFVGRSGLSAGGAVRVNIDRWVKYGNKPSNIGGIVQVAYSAQPTAAERARAAAGPREPAGAAAAAPAPEPSAVTPALPTPTSTVAPAPLSEPGAGTATGTTEVTPSVVSMPPPAPRPTTSTTDEVLFDTAKSRLTNIAKAILDGVALRLKNSLSATCTISSWTDAAEKGGDHAALARSRAEAAKDYLVKRHGIDASRVKVETKGDGDASDSTRNRRAVVTVTFP
jgi:outer membrane protein OmpA-like peptidoglycan-associated protein